MKQEVSSKIILLIDTSSNKQVIVGLKMNDKEDIVTKDLDKQRAQVVLPIIEQLIAKHKISFRDLSMIEVNIGPGSFTGLRVGVAIANTLGQFLQIPINNKRVGVMVEPTY